MRILPEIQRSRLTWIFGVYAIVFLAIIVRAVEIQLVKSDILVEKTKKISETWLDFGSVRGELYDRNGEKLASSVAVNSVSVDANILKERGETFYRLSKALNMDYEKLARTFENLKSVPGTSGASPNRPIKNRTFSWIKRHISDEEAESIKELKDLKGIRLEKEYRREYPNGSLAAHLLGFVGKDGQDGQGLEGLELALEKYLRVLNPARVIVRQDRLGRIIMDRPNQYVNQPKGASVMLTLDRQIQRLTEAALEKAVIERNAKSGQALVVRVKTGEILASAVYPTFDPNNYQKSDSSDRRNRVLTDPYEPGSIFKLFTVAAALEEKLITPDTVFFCENGLYKIDGTTASVKDTGRYGDLSVRKIVQVSSNIGAVKIGERLGPYKFHNYLTRFAFGEKTGLAYPSGESPGLLRPAKDWKPLDLASTSFGQSLSVTSLQVTMAVAALANEGALMRPTLVSRIIDENGRVIEQSQRHIVRQVVSRLTASQVMEMMRQVVLPGGSGWRAEIPGYPVAGKTATSQTVEPGTSVYSKDKYVASFVGVAPYYDPELCVFVSLTEPWPNFYGGEIAAPVFKAIMENSLPLLDIPMVNDMEDPVIISESKGKVIGGVPGVVSESSPVNFLMVKLKKGDRGRAGPIPDLVQDYKGLAADNLDFDGVAVETEPIVPPTEAGAPGVMPSLKGRSMREVKDILSPFLLSVEYLGSGLANGQDPAPGTLVEVGQTARISFGAP
jgi:cell division protein FtsI (penicillin-binding protein 3)